MAVALAETCLGKSCGSFSCNRGTPNPRGDDHDDHSVDGKYSDGNGNAVARGLTPRASTVGVGVARGLMPAMRVAMMTLRGVIPLACAGPFGRSPEVPRGVSPEACRGEMPRPRMVLTISLDPEVCSLDPGVCTSKLYTALAFPTTPFTLAK